MGDEAVWDATSSWDIKVEVPAKVIESVDENVLAKMPPGTTIKGIHAHGASYWSRTAEIQTLKNDGSPQSYYIKATQNRFGLKMFHGEFESSKAIYDVCPDFIPEPIAYGTFASIPNTHFYLAQFIDMADELPDIDTFPEKLAELHKKATSSQYGFHYQTMTALLPLYVTQTESWEEFFANFMKHLMAAEKLAQGPASEEQLRLESVFFDRIIPRLIRPLETGGRQIQPRLVHSDLWDGNAAVNVETEAPVIFDPSCFYAHNEFEMGPWRVPRHRTGKPYIEMYHKFFPKSAPEEDYDGRNLLYSVAFEARASACWVGTAKFREVMIKLFKELEEMYPETYGQWAEAKGEPAHPRKGTA